MKTWGDSQNPASARNTLPRRKSTQEFTLHTAARTALTTGECPMGSRGVLLPRTGRPWRLHVSKVVLHLLKGP